MTENRKRMSWWGGALVAAWLAIGYPLSIGPVGGFETRGMLPPWAVSALAVFYAPLQWAYVNGPQAPRDALDWYMGLWVP